MPQDWFAQNAPQGDSSDDWFAANAPTIPNLKGQTLEGATPRLRALTGASSPPPPPSIWDRINSGLIPPEIFQGALTGSSTGFKDARDLPIVEGETHGPARVALAGMGDTASRVASSFTNPISLGMMGAGALAKGAGMVGSAARGFLTGAGLGFGGQGVIQAGQNLDLSNPDQLERFLLGASQVAGAAPAVANAGANLPGPRHIAQETMNIGPRLTTKAQTAADTSNQAEVAKTNAENEAAQAKADTLNQRVKQKIDTFNQAAQQDYDQGLQDYRQKTAEVHSQNDLKAQLFKAKAAQTQRENVQKLAEHKDTVQRLTELNDARQEDFGSRARLANDLTSNGEKLATELKVVEKNFRAQGSQKFEDVAKATEGDVADPEPIRDAVNHAEKSIIRGSPESLKIFRNILNGTAGEAPTMDGVSITPDMPVYQRLMDSGAIEPPQSIGMRDLQGYYTELGNKLSGGDLPDDVYRALKYVKENGIGSEMKAIAERNGVGDLLTTARSHWKDLMTDFHDMRPVKQGGSPLARTIRAVDPDAAVEPFLSGDAGVRAINTLGKYSPELARVAGQSVAKFNHLKTLPTTLRLSKIPKPPKGTKIDIPPEMTQPPPPPDQPTLKTAPTPVKAVLKTPDLKTVNPQQLKQEAIERIADGARGLGGWKLYADLAALATAAGFALTGSPYHAAGYLAVPVGRRLFGATLQHLSIARWLSQPTPQELGRPSAPSPPPNFSQAASQAIASGTQRKPDGSPPPRPQP